MAQNCQQMIEYIPLRVTFRFKINLMVAGSNVCVIRVADWN